MSDFNYYAAPQAELGPGSAGNPFVGSVTIATRLSRCLAVIVESFIWMIAAIPMAVGAVFSVEGGDVALMVGMMMSGAILLGLAVANLYLLATNGQTIGKKIMGIKIVRSDLVTPASFWRIVGLRYLPVSLMGMVPFVGGLLQFGNYLMIFGAEQRCGHDLIADTHVVVDGGKLMDTADSYGHDPYYSGGQSQQSYSQTPGPGSYHGGGSDNSGDGGGFSDLGF